MTRIRSRCRSSTRIPQCPCPKRDGLSLFDGTRNYIDWLLSASTDDLRSEIFRDEAGERILPPKALLYRLLHNAWTTQLVWSSKDLFTRLHAELAYRPRRAPR